MLYTRDRVSWAGPPPAVMPGDLGRQAESPPSPTRLFHALARALARQPDVDHVLSIALPELRLALPTHVAAIWLTETSGEVAFVLAKADESATALGLALGSRLTLRQSGFALCWQEGQSVMTALPGVEDPGPAWLAELTRHGMGCSLAIPLRAAERTIGVLQSVIRDQTEFSDGQLQLLHELADLLGPAITTCQHFAQLRTAYEELSQKQQQYLQTEKLRVLGELAGGMAHHFNNSLCGVLGYLQLGLQEPALPQPVRGHLSAARTCAFNAAATMRRIQEFARQEKRELSVRVLDLNNLVRQTAQQIQPQCAAGACPIRVEVQTESTAWVRGCAAELREVLTHLTRNAVQAMPRGGDLTLRTWNDRHTVYLSVRDTGVGMSPEIQQRLFEPFFTTRSDERGTGLGLSVVYGIVKRHDGDIRLESAPGQGSCFEVRLPVAADLAALPG